MALSPGSPSCRFSGKDSGYDVTRVDNAARVIAGASGEWCRGFFKFGRRNGHWTCNGLECAEYIHSTLKVEHTMNVQAATMVTIVIASGRAGRAGYLQYNELD